MTNDENKLKIADPDYGGIFKKTVLSYLVIHK